MKTYNQFNEGVRDQMTPKSKEDIINDLKKLNPDQKILVGYEYELLWLIKLGLEEGGKTSNHAGYLLMDFAKVNGREDIIQLLKDRGVEDDVDLSIINKVIPNRKVDETIKKDMLTIKYDSFLNENVYKDEFLRLYNLAPESLKKLVDETKNVEQGADWHPEGVVYIHIRLVTNRLENTYHDKNLNLAGFFHDLGKTHVTIPNGRGGFSAHGHEDESVKIVDEYKDWIKEQGGAVDIVSYVVENHMRYKYLNEMRIQEQIRFIDDIYFPYVQKFATADIGGTDLNCIPIDEHKEIKAKISEFYKKEEENRIISKKFNAGMIMDKYPELRGEKLGNALNLFKRNYEDFRSFVLNNTTEDVLKAFDDYMNQ